MPKKTNSGSESFLEQLAEKILSDKTVATAFRDFQRTAANLSDAITKKNSNKFCHGRIKRTDVVKRNIGAK